MAGSLLMHMIQRAKAKLATPFMRRLLRRPGIFPVRRELSFQYITGSGVEVGALNAPLEVRPNVMVKYADLHETEPLRSDYAPDLISDLESMAGIDDASQNFVIANHVLEHVENPLRALRSVNRVLQPGGIAFIALPDKRYTFDKRRAVTPLAHLIRDFEEGPGWSAGIHYLDWAENVEGLRGKEAEDRASILLSTHDNIHFHVWDFVAMKEMFSYVQSITDLTVQHSRQNRSECIWIVSRR
jgi:SAM-dependent methyltransferase